MKYCEHCGSSIDDNAVFCPNCSKSTTQNNNNTQNYRTDEVDDNSQSDNSILIGALSIAFAFYIPLIGIILGLVGLLRDDSTPKNRKLSRIGLIISIFTTVIPIIFGILCFILYLIFCYYLLLLFLYAIAAASTPSIILPFLFI